MARPAAPVGRRRTPPPSPVEADRKRLEEARDLLEGRLADATDAALPALVARYTDLIEKIAALPAAVKEENELDRLRKRRAARKPASGQ